jgi:excisionase family DNA binding protein
VKLMRMPEVAAVLDIPLSRAYELVRAGLLPVVRVGRQVRVDPALFRDWVVGGGSDIAARRKPLLRQAATTPRSPQDRPQD